MMTSEQTPADGGAPATQGAQRSVPDEVPNHRPPAEPNLAGVASSGARPRRGVLSRRVRAIPASGIRRFFDIMTTMEDVISLSVGEPDFITPRHILQRAVDSLYAGETHYTSNYGLPELRAAIAEHLERLYGVSYDPATEIIVTTGVSEGLDIALRALLDPGDEVIVPEPTYVSYQPLTVLAGGTAVPVPTRAEDGFRLKAEAVRAAITPKTKVLLLGFPCNPTGAVLERTELEAIARLVVEHDLYVISDEIYDRLTYGVPHTCVPSVPGLRERTILLNGFSKAYAMTGWRLGYACAPADILEGMMKVHQYAMMCAPTPSQYAAIEALRCGEADVQRMVAEYDQRRRLIVKGLNEIGLTCHEPQGAFYAFPSIACTGLSSMEFSERLLFEEKVSVVPGSAFGASGEGHVRVCYGSSIENLERALERMHRFVRRYSR
jgi:aminotransferase